MMVSMMITGMTSHSPPQLSSSPLCVLVFFAAPFTKTHHDHTRQTHIEFPAESHLMANSNFNSIQFLSIIMSGRTGGEEVRVDVKWVQKWQKKSQFHPVLCCLLILFLLWYHPVWLVLTPKTKGGAVLGRRLCLVILAMDIAMWLMTCQCATQLDKLRGSPPSKLRQLPWLISSSLYYHR